MIFGLGRFGTAIAIRLKRNGLRVLGIDYGQGWAIHAAFRIDELAHPPDTVTQVTDQTDAADLPG